MEIENSSMRVDVKLSLKEIRVMEYSLRKAKDIAGIDILLSNIDEMIGDFRKLLSDNWILTIEEEPLEPIVLSFDKEKIEIILSGFAQETQRDLSVG